MVVMLNYRRWKNRVALGFMGLAVVVCLVPLVSVLFTLVTRGAGAIRPGFFTHLPAPVGETGGIANAILGTLLLLALASAVSVPLGLATGMYLAQRSGTRLARVTRPLLDALAGIPAIVVGVFIYT